MRADCSSVALIKEPLNSFPLIRAVLGRGLRPLMLGNAIPDTDVKIYESRERRVLKNVTSDVGEHLSFFIGVRAVLNAGRARRTTPAS